MKGSSTLALGAFLLVAGCAGTRTPKLARCTGPYRYANPYGTVLPTLPIPGQLMNPPAAAPSAAQVPSRGASAAPAPLSLHSANAPAVESDPPPPARSPSAPSGSDRAQPGKTSGLLPSYSSC